jgi:hypothetical protein
MGLLDYFSDNPTALGGMFNGMASPSNWVNPDTGRSASDPYGMGAGGLLGGGAMSPLAQGLFGAALALSQAGQPTRVPTSGLGAFGAGAGAFGQSYNQGVRNNLQSQYLGAQGRSAQTQADLGALTLGGYQRMQQRLGGPPTAGGVISGSMPGGPAPSGDMFPVNPAAAYGTPQSAFTANPDAPGAELRPVAPQAAGIPNLLGNPSAPATSRFVMPQGGPGAAPFAGGGQGPGAVGTGAPPPPLFNTADLMQQYRIAAATPGMAGQASQILSLIQKGTPEGAYIAVDGSIQARPGFNQYLAGKSYADAYGKGAGDLQFAGPITSAQEWAKVAPQLAEKRGEPFSLTRPGEVRYDGAGNVVAQAPIAFKGVDANGTPFQDYRFLPTSPSAGGGGATPYGSGLVSSALDPGGLGGGVPSVGAGSGGQYGTRVQTGLSPMAEASAKERGGELEKYGAGLIANATAAQQQNFTIDQMIRESGGGSGWTPGLFAEHVGDIRSILNGFHFSNADTDAALANFQAFQKNSMGLVTQATRAVSPRAAVQEMQMIAHALPNAKISQGGLGFMFDQFGAVNDFTKAKAQAADAWRPTHGGTLDGFESNWNKEISPMAFLAHRMNESDLTTMANNLKGTSQGRALLSRIMGEMSFANNNGLFQDAGQ